MYAVAFDLSVDQTKISHPKGVSQAYAEIGSILSNYGFRWFRVAFTLRTTKTWRSSFRPYWHCVLHRGFQVPSATFVPFGLSNGPISLRS
jgi:hypothetical protein